MSKLEWLDRGEDSRRPVDAVGYLASTAEDSEAVLVVARDAEGDYHMRAFGEMGYHEVAMIAALLAYQVGRDMHGDDPGEG